MGYSKINNTLKGIFAITVIIALIVLAVYSLGFDLNRDKDKQVNGIFEQTEVIQVEVTAWALNMRSGIGTNHKIVRRLHKGDILEVLGRVGTVGGSWYVVKTGDDAVGAVSGKYVTELRRSPHEMASHETTRPEQPQQPQNPQPQPPQNGNFTAQQLEMLQYINAERAKVGAKPLQLDSQLNYGAYLKSKDMADLGYFSHTSPTYGSPFNQMKSLGIRYSWAGENIAKHFSVRGAHVAFMNSPGHRANILKSEFGKVGLGFVQKGSYLYVTQWFTN